MLADLITDLAMAPYDFTKWAVATAHRKNPEWVTPNRVVLDRPVAKLRDFSTTYSDATPTLILPPMAGHASTIVDYSGQSQVQLVLDHGLTHLYAIDWKGATQDTKDVTIEDRMAFVTLAVHLIAGFSGKVNLIGNCQGGWESSVWAALNPERVNTLTVAGAPIDTSVGDSLTKTLLPILVPGGSTKLFELAVASMGGVWPGINMISAFMLMHPTSHPAAHIKLFGDIRDSEKVERFSKFYDWYFHPVNLSGALYLWAVKHLFVDNELYRGVLKVGGETVDLHNIKAPVFLLAGESDDITPPEQQLNMANVVGSEEVHTHTAPGGHIGLFIGGKSQRDFWPLMLARVRELS
jgi:poly(3-hydroxyalkanoate) synthetase